MPPFSAPHHLYNPVCRLRKCGLQADCTNCEVRGMACNPRCSAAEEGLGSILLEESNGTGPIPPTSKTKKLAISAALPRPVWAGGAQKVSGAENKKTKKSTIPARKLFGIGCNKIDKSVHKCLGFMIVPFICKKEMPQLFILVFPSSVFPFASRIIQHKPGYQPLWSCRNMHL